MDKEVVKELIQDQMNTKNLNAELRNILNPDHRAVLLKNYDELEKKLGGQGASQNTADLIFKKLKTSI